MDHKQKYIKYKVMYKNLLNKINKSNVGNNKINNGNIKMEEDYVFEQTNNDNLSMKGRTSLSIEEAKNDLNKYFE